MRGVLRAWARNASRKMSIKEVNALARSQTHIYTQLHQRRAGIDVGSKDSTMFTESRGPR